MLLTRLPLGIATPFDLHVLGTPPALVLSQDQTLHKNFYGALIGSRNSHLTHLVVASVLDYLSRLRTSPPKAGLKWRASSKFEIVQSLDQQAGDPQTYALAALFSFQGAIPNRA